MSDKRTDAPPTVTQLGKEKERERDILPQDTIIASALSSFSLSLFNVIQDNVIDALPHGEEEI